jgi:hypothetical protein
MPAVIGQWVQRVYDQSQYKMTLFHRVESFIEEAAVTKCGRRMRPHTLAKSGNKLIYRDEWEISGNDQCSDCI